MDLTFTLLGSDKFIEICKYQPSLLAQVVTLATQVTEARGTHVQGPHGLENELRASLHNLLKSCLKVT